MHEQRVKAFVAREYVALSLRSCLKRSAQMESDVEVERVATAAVNFQKVDSLETMSGFGPTRGLWRLLLCAYEHDRAIALVKHG